MYTFKHQRKYLQQQYRQAVIALDTDEPHHSPVRIRAHHEQRPQTIARSKTLHVWKQQAHVGNVSD